MEVQLNSSVTQKQSICIQSCTHPVGDGILSHLSPSWAQRYDKDQLIQHVLVCSCNKIRFINIFHNTAAYTRLQTVVHIDLSTNVYYETQSNVLLNMSRSNKLKFTNYWFVIKLGANKTRLFQHMVHCIFLWHVFTFALIVINFIRYLIWWVFV